MKSPTEGLHHYHLRKRVHKNLEPYPHENKYKNFMDKMIYIAGFLGILMTLPQLLKIWVDKNATGVSLTSWVSYFIIAIFWLVYGIMHKEKPIVFNYSLWIFMYIFIIAGIIMYG